MISARLCCRVCVSSPPAPTRLVLAISRGLSLLPPVCYNPPRLSGGISTWQTSSHRRRTLCDPASAGLAISPRERNSRAPSSRRGRPSDRAMPLPPPSSPARPAACSIRPPPRGPSTSGRPLAANLASRDRPPSSPLPTRPSCPDVSYGPTLVGPFLWPDGSRAFFMALVPCLNRAALTLQGWIARILRGFPAWLDSPSIP